MFVEPPSLPRRLTSLPRRLLSGARAAAALPRFLLRGHRYVPARVLLRQELRVLSAIGNSVFQLLIIELYPPPLHLPPPSHLFSASAAPL